MGVNSELRLDNTASDGRDATIVGHLARYWSIVLRKCHIPLTNRQRCHGTVITEERGEIPVIRSV